MGQHTVITAVLNMSELRYRDYYTSEIEEVPQHSIPLSSELKSVDNQYLKPVGMALCSMEYCEISCLCFPKHFPVPIVRWINQGD